MVSRLAIKKAKHGPDNNTPNIIFDFSITIISLEGFNGGQRVEKFGRLTGERPPGVRRAPADAPRFCALVSHLFLITESI